MKIIVEHSTDRLLGSEEIKVTIESTPEDKAIHYKNEADSVLKSMVDHGIKLINEIKKQ